MANVSVGFRPPCWCSSGWAPTWRLRTKLNKFGKNPSSETLHMKDFTDLNLGEIRKYSSARWQHGIAISTRAMRIQSSTVCKCRWSTASKAALLCTVTVKSSFRVLCGSLYDHYRKLKARSIPLGIDSWWSVKGLAAAFLLRVRVFHEKTSEGVIMLKSRILLKLGRIVRCAEILPST